MKIFFLVVSSALLIAADSLSQDITWPRQLTNEGTVITMYQPQVESWEKYKKLDFRLAFSLKPNQGKEVLGVLYMNAATDADMETHRVLINNMSVSQTHFPSLDAENAEKMGKIVRSFVTPDRYLVMSLEQIVACTPKEDTATAVNVNNAPPVIFASKRPTILLQLEGAPAKAAASKENIEFVINASYPLFFDVPNSTWYLYDGLEWQKGKEPGGPWSFTGSLPNSLVNLAKDSNWSSLKNFIPAVSKADKKMPQVFYSEKLAELILFEGEPSFKSISGTALKYAANTDSDIFLCSSDKQYYYITSGRWFRSSGLNGPWTFATFNLPADFSKIPLSSPASAILSFVPGTEQAKDAVMIAQIPTTIEVNVTEAAKQVNIVYSGEPEFKPIDSTTLYYAVNTSEKVIKVNSNSYFACVQGIWFESTTPKGPWKTATVVPQIIYSIPPSSPVYNVTYVTQNIATTNTVEASYSSGYTGIYVTGPPSTVIIVSGTGYYHPPYYYYPPYGYPVYYPYPVTYGIYAYHPYYYGGVAYHASYNPNTGMYARSATAYSPYGKATVAQGYNPSTGTYARGASVSTPYGTRSGAQAYNPYTGASAATRQGSSPYGQWGSSVVSNGNGQWAQTGHASNSQGTVAGARTSSGSKVIAGSGDNGTGMVAKSGSTGDVFASKDGNVYKKTDEGWHKYENGNWNSTDKPQQHAGATTSNTATQNNAAAQRPASAQQPSTGTNQRASSGQNYNTQSLNSDYQNRQNGNMSTQQYSGRSNASAGSMQRGGGRSGGGGGRRR